MFVQFNMTKLDWVAARNVNIHAQDILIVCFVTEMKYCIII